MSNLLIMGMDSIYKDALQKLRANTQSEQGGFQSSWNYIKSIELEVSEEEGQNLPPEVEASSELKADGPSEKEEMVSSLKEFGQKLLEQSDLDEVNFNGVNIKATESIVHEVAKEASLEVISSELAGFYPEEIAELKLETAKDYTSNVKVFFVTDSLVEKALFENFEAYGVINCYFKAEVSKLFYNMASALKLDLKDLYISSIKAQNEDVSEHLAAEILALKPEYIVTLGATATMQLLKSEQRLKSVHGQFFDLNFNSPSSNHQCKLMPLFSPKLLHTAPNMKKTAWRDMQKLIEKLS